MLIFKAQDLIPVIQEALSNQCKMALVVNHGVFIFSVKTEWISENKAKHMAYAQGCNPEIDEFDDWWNLIEDEFGDHIDDVIELDPNDSCFKGVLRTQYDLVLKDEGDKLYLSIQKPL